MAAQVGNILETNPMLSHLDMAQVREHYLHRRELHNAILKAFTAKDAVTYSNLALGISDSAGNYSAAEHHLGTKILAVNGPVTVLNLAQTLNACTLPRKIPDLLYAANLKYLKISVGSEMSMLLQPEKFWTTNVRTVWSHLLIEYGDDYEKANNALSVFRGSSDDKDDRDRESADMSYKLWSDIHIKLETSLKRLNALSQTEAEKQGVQTGKLKYLWADAIANKLYEDRTKA